jgi:hypothetical protein
MAMKFIGVITTTQIGMVPVPAGPSAARPVAPSL